MKIRIFKLTAIIFAVITLISVIPITSLAAPASDIPAEMLDNAYLDALEYTGYKVAAQKDDGTIFKKYSNAAPASVRSGIGYGTGPSGLETTAEGLPDIAKFRSHGLCCASYVSYVLYNYLPNVAHIDTSVLPCPANPRSAASYNDAANSWVENSRARRISFTQSGSSFTPSESIPIGSVVIFKNISNGAVAHVALYAGYYDGQHFVTHVGNDNGPELCTIVGMSKGSSPESVVQIVTPQVLLSDGIIMVYKKDTNGKNLSGAYFVATSNQTGIQYLIGPTDENGYAESKEGMPYGTYTLKETVFPKNYASYGQTEWTVTVSEATQEVTVNAVNILQMGKIFIEKKGEIFWSVTGEDGIYTPVYEERGLENAIFNIIAAEDIVTPDGTVMAVKGAVVDTVTSNAEGKAETKELHLGKYFVSEAYAPEGTVLNSEPAEVTLTYAGETVSVTQGFVSITNKRQKASVSFKKVLETEEASGIGENGEMANVKFGLFAAEDLTARDGSVIPKDGLLEVITPDTDGNAVFTADIPFGSKLYVKEIETDGKYVLPDKYYPVEFDCQTQNESNTEILVNNGEIIENKIIRGNVQGLKTDEQGNVLEGAVFGLFKFGETEFEENNALMLSSSDKDGHFEFKDIPFGEYTVKEISGIYGYRMSKEEFYVNITENGQTESIICINEKIYGSVTVNKLSAYDTGLHLSGAEFEVFADMDENGVFEVNTDMPIGKLTETETGTYRLTGLKAGKYFLLERTAPKGYVRDIRFYPFEISEGNSSVEIENEIGVGFLNTPINPLPKTGDVTDSATAIIIMLLSLVGMTLISVAEIKKMKKRGK